MRGLHALIGIWQRLTRGVRRRRLDRDIDEELRFHLDMRAAEQARDGVAEPDLVARRRFGNVGVVKEQVRDMWTFPSFESFWQDIRYALRMLRRTPGFTLVAVLALSVGIGANTAIFSLVDAMLVRGLPYAHADRLVLVIGNVQRAAVERRGASYPDYLDWRAQATSFEDLAAYSSSTTTLTGDEEPERLNAETVSAPYFRILGEAPALGRVFRDEEDQVPDRDAVVVLADGLWRRRFGADPSVVGRTIVLDGRAYRILGVMPPGFTGLSDQADLWVPFVMSGPGLDSRGRRWFNAVARLKSGVTEGQAQSEMDAISQRLETAYPTTNEKRGAEVIGLGVETFSNLRPAVLTLMAAVVFVLLIACANVANLLISRSEVRQQEMAVRAALGAGRRRLVRQLVTESLVLAGLGAIGGLVLASVAVRTLVATSPVALPSFLRPGLDPTVLLFTIGMAGLSGLLLGLAPATHARASAMNAVLKDATRGSTGARSRRLRGVLVVAEVSLAVVLLVGAGLLVRSVQKLTAIDPGFDPQSVLSMSVSIPRLPVPAVPRVPAVSAPVPAPPLVVPPRVLLERVRAVPGVTAASLASDVPLGGSSSAVFYGAEGDTTTDAQTMPRAYYHRVTPEFFATLRIPIVSGRTFLDNETTPDSTAVVVSDGVARRFWPGQDAVGHRIKFGSASSPNPWLTIVGVVGDVKYRGLPENPTADPDLFLPALDRPAQSLLVRTSVPPDRVAPAVRAAIREAGPAVVIYNVAALESLVSRQSAQSRFTTWLMGVFAAAAMLLSVVGIYGVMSYLVNQRRREFGIRLALGASRRQIVRLVLRHGARMVAVGVVIGAVASAGVARLLQSMLFGVSAVDVSSAAVVALLGIVALVACYVPAVRATRVDPVVALRND
jgi:putative ABC transport system permease protein